MNHHRVRTGYDSFKSLGSSFLSSIIIVGGGSSRKPPASNSSESCNTQFFLKLQNDTHPCAGSDWIVLFLQFVICHAISWWTRWLVLEPFAKWLMDKRATKKRVEKFSQALVATLFHVLSGCFAYQVLHDKPWLWEQDEWEKQTSNTIIEPDFKFYYLLYAARYMSDLVSLRYEHKRSDTFAYAIHHAATILLVLGSAATGYFRFGGVLMLFLDWADPPLLLAKAFKYASRHLLDWFQFCADRLFELFAVMFVLTRNIAFTVVAWHAIVVFENNTAETYVLKFFLVVLILLMKFWLFLIVRAAIHQFREDHVKDIRSDDESIEDEKPPAVARKKKLL